MNVIFLFPKASRMLNFKEVYNISIHTRLTFRSRRSLTLIVLEIYIYIRCYYSNKSARVHWHQLPSTHTYCDGLRWRFIGTLTQPNALWSRFYRTLTQPDALWSRFCGTLTQPDAIWSRFCGTLTQPNALWSRFCGTLMQPYALWSRFRGTHTQLYALWPRFWRVVA